MSHALALTCSLRKSPSSSSSELLANQMLRALGELEVSGECVRAVDYDIAPGVETDMGDGDQWPRLRQKLLASDIFVLATPTWLGHASSVAHRVLERLDAELSEKDEDGRKTMSGKVALVAVVGNEDGAHKIVADCYQALNDIGFTIPANGCTYWNSNITDPKDYLDLGEVPEAVDGMTKTAAANAAHLADLLAKHPYPVR